MTEVAANAWLKIWSGRGVAEGTPDILSALIQANGFDSGAGFYANDDWLEMVAGGARRARLTRHSRVLEIGCGAGAFLYALRALIGCTVAGIDYSESLIQSATKHVPEGEFVVSEAVNIPFPDSSFDAIFSHSVFQYFPDEQYAKKVCANAQAKLRNGGVFCVLDVNDQQCEARFHEERAQLFGDEAAYARRYADLPHTFYVKTRFCGMLREVGFEQVSLVPHDAKRYANRHFRFNVLAIK